MQSYTGKLKNIMIWKQGMLSTLGLMLAFSLLQACATTQSISDSGESNAELEADRIAEETRRQQDEEDAELDAAEERWQKELARRKALQKKRAEEAAQAAEEARKAQEELDRLTAEKKAREEAEEARLAEERRKKEEAERRKQAEQDRIQAEQDRLVREEEERKRKEAAAKKARADRIARKLKEDHLQQSFWNQDTARRLGKRRVILEGPLGYKYVLHENPGPLQFQTYSQLKLRLRPRLHAGETLPETAVNLTDKLLLKKTNYALLMIPADGGSAREYQLPTLRMDGRQFYVLNIKSDGQDLLVLELESDDGKLEYHQVVTQELLVEPR